MDKIEFTEVFALGVFVGLILGLIFAHLRHARIEDAERTDDD